MGYPVCGVCDEGLGFPTEISPPHVCDRDKILNKMKRLEDEARTYRNETRLIRNLVYQLLKSTCEKEGMEAANYNVVMVDKQLLQSLWEAANCQWINAKTAQDFQVMWLATHGVLCEAFDLFESNPQGKLDKSVLGRLNDLREACEQAAKTLGYWRDGKFDVSPADITGSGKVK